MRSVQELVGHRRAEDEGARLIMDIAAGTAGIATTAVR